jgi:putative endonuclease
MEPKYYVYIMASLSGVLYVGVTGNLERRVQEHKAGALEGFTEKYRCHQLVYYEEFRYVDKAIEREKQLKAWSRGKKMKLIQTLNPRWEDLGASINA